MRTVYFITSNKGKVHEAQTKCEPIGITIVQKNIGYPEIQVDSLEEVATYGIEHVRKKVDHPFILEDAGLFIDALKGFPGVYSSYAYYTIGLDGILKLLTDVPIEQRTATFRSVFGYGEPDGNEQLFVGECKGTIGYDQKGKFGFGYDPIFIPNGKKNTFAEMQTEEKNMLSHRGGSLGKLIQFLSELS
jgi:XTP/dITP diphosphohydrolase